ncbi:MAG TPA: metallophosphoesterase, partial [Bacteroidetes bacterium]|nr:metallophosphoesterase [Bacteroidota bacterium]
MKIAHLSDLHLCMKNRPMVVQQTKQLIQYALEQGIDHLVITGDISHNNEPQDFIALRKLLQEFGLLDPNKLSLTIGNHDIFGGVYFATDIAAFPEKCKHTNYRQEVREFKHYFSEAFENAYFPLPYLEMTYAKSIDNVVIIGINSIDRYSSLRNPFASAGVISSAQFDGLKMIFSKNNDKNCKKIVLIHHHFNHGPPADTRLQSRFWKMIENYANRLSHKKRLLRLFKKQHVDLILHGHKHESVEYRKMGLHFLNAGGTIDTNHSDELRVNFITIENDEIQTEIRTLPA